MNERRKAEALSQSLDALLHGKDSTSADEEIRQLTELGRALSQVEFEPSAAHQAAVEELQEKHLQQAEAPTAVERSARDREGSGTRPLFRKLIPLAGGVALLLACVVLAVVGGGMAWRGYRQARTVVTTTPLAISEEGPLRDDSPLSPPTPERGAAQDASPLPRPTAETHPVHNPTAEEDSASQHTVYLPMSVHPLSPQSAMLTGIRGLVEVQTEGAKWVLAHDGRVVKAGQRVRTGALSAASLSFYEGSVASLGPGTEVSLDDLDAHPDDGARIVELSQWSGETKNRVVPASSPNALYRVHTPSGDGEAKGTLFHVSVIPAMQTRISVDQGAVEVTNLGVTVLVVAGQLVVSPVDQAPSTPTFRIIGEGEVTEIGATWTVAEQTFSTHDSTVIVGNPQVGDWVFVDGHLLLDGTRVADRIELLCRSPANQFTLVGTVDDKEDETWTVAGQAIAVDDDTVVQGEVAEGELVHVEGLVMPDGTLLAQYICPVEDDLQSPFDFIGVVQSIADDEWRISGISITVATDTQIDPLLEIGDVARARGWVVEEERWEALSIERVGEHEREFEFTGYVETIDPWKVSGIAFQTRVWTEVEAGIVKGGLVKVSGRIQEDGTWVADEIERIDREKTLTFELVGRVSSMDRWEIGPISLTVDDETEIEDGIGIGSWVKVEGRILPDGTWLATEIKLVDRIELGPGCLTLTAVVIGLSPNQLELPSWPLIPLNGVIIEGELQVGSVIMLLVCIDEDGTINVVGIIVLHQPDPVVVPPEWPDDGAKVAVCHKPESKNPHTITISQSALKAHLGHGDTIGPCP